VWLGITNQLGITIFCINVSDNNKKYQVYIFFLAQSLNKDGIDHSNVDEEVVVECSFRWAAGRLTSAASAPAIAANCSEANRSARRALKQSFNKSINK
jgi:hypothetical protein